MDKSRLRSELKLKRQQLSEQDVGNYSQKITLSTWRIIDWSQIHSIHCFLPIAKNNEINTLPILRVARQANFQLKIATTDINKETFWLDENLNPTKKVPENFQFGLIIVPMLGFDKSGYRLGYGGGFYDKFLATQHQAQIIGVCYEFGILPKLSHEEHDIPVPTIITEKLIYKF